jgi:predicted amidophosphoribosyltransferase
MIFCNLENNQSSQIMCLGEYHPYRIEGQKNPHFDQWSGRILALKRSEAPAIELFYRKLNPLLGTNFAIATVPSSNSEKVSSGIRKLAIRLAANQRIDATSCLVRHQSIDKLATGGRRSQDIHFDSIRVQNCQLVQGQEVLLLDDVSTSGNSLLACKALLMDAGAKSVQCLVLGQTVRNVANDEDAVG